MAFEVPDVGGQYLTVFDLTATGSIHFLWPTSPDDDDPIPAGEAFTLDAEVTPPFGADNLIVIATETPPEGLRAELKTLDGSKEPAALMNSVQEAVSRAAYRIGIQAFFTGKKAS
jgi:hypothetical protein